MNKPLKNSEICNMLPDLNTITLYVKGIVYRRSTPDDMLESLQVNEVFKFSRTVAWYEAENFNGDISSIVFNPLTFYYSKKNTKTRYRGLINVHVYFYRLDCIDKIT